MPRAAYSDEMIDISATVSNFPSTVHYALASTTPQHNIVIGSDPVQIRFIEQVSGLTAQRVDRVSDSTLLAGTARTLFLVDAAYQVDLSPEMLKRTARWSATQVTKGSPTIRAVVELANTLAPSGIKGKLKDAVNIVGDELTKNGVYDLHATLWQAVSMLGAPVKAQERWPEPWDAPILWMPSDADPGFRLNSLYRTLISYALIKTRTPEVARAFGVSPSKANWLASLSLDGVKVYKAVLILSRWRNERTPSYICALKISALWA